MEDMDKVDKDTVDMGIPVVDTDMLLVVGKDKAYQMDMLDIHSVEELVDNSMEQRVEHQVHYVVGNDKVHQEGILDKDIDEHHVMVEQKEVGNFDVEEEVDNFDVEEEVGNFVVVDNPQEEEECQEFVVDTVVFALEEPVEVTEVVGEGGKQVIYMTKA